MFAHLDGVGVTGLNTYGHVEQHELKFTFILYTFNPKSSVEIYIPKKFVLMSVCL